MGENASIINPEDIKLSNKQIWWQRFKFIFLFGFMKGASLYEKVNMLMNLMSLISLLGKIIYDINLQSFTKRVNTEKSYIELNDWIQI